MPTAMCFLLSGAGTDHREGDIAIIGPDTIALQGGMGGTYVKVLGYPVRNFVITVPDRRGNKDTVSGYGLISGENQRERIRVTL